MALDWLHVAAALLVAAGIVICAFGLAANWRWRQLDRRLRQYLPVDPLEASDLPALPGAGARPGSPLSAGLHRRLSRSSYAARLQLLLVRAGMQLKASEFILLQAGVGVGLALLGALLLGTFGSLLLATLGFFMPYFLLQLRARQRLDSFEKQLPAAIDAMAGSLQAGSSLTQAMEVIAREMASPIAPEFRRLLREIELGLPLPESLANLVERVPSGDLFLLTSAITIQHRVGGDLAQIFRGISHTIRERLRVRGETRVLTAQARYSAYVIAALPVFLFLFLYLTNYAYLSGLFLPGLTRVLLAGAVIGIVVGFYAMNRIASVDV